MFEEPGSDSCPVHLFEIFTNKRPQEMSITSSRFYLQAKIFTNKKKMLSDPVWYKRQVNIDLVPIYRSTVAATVHII